MNCNCKSDNRRIALIAQNPVERYPELSRFGAENGWELWRPADVFLIDVGYAKQFRGMAELVNFCRTILDGDRFQSLRATFIDPSQAIEAQLPSIIHAQPLGETLDTDSSPLVDILAQRRLETWYQPVISATDNSVWGYECLVRGRADNSDVIFPAQLLEWARAEKLTFMLDRLCREMHVRNGAAAGLAPNVRLLINFLPTAIYQPQFCLQTTLAAVAESGLSPGQIVFEVVETEKIADREHLKKILEFYREAGFMVALDDVGSGYSGLSLFADLRPDLIKIDRELVSKSAESDFHRGVCSALINLSKQAGQLVLAEGVETQKERDLMKELGVDLFQGYFFAKPKPRMEQPVQIGC